MKLRHYQGNTIARGGHLEGWTGQDLHVGRAVVEALRAGAVDVGKLRVGAVPAGVLARVLERLEREWFIWRREGKWGLTRGAVRQIYDGWDRGKRRVLLVAPTGAGKTEVAIKVSADCVAQRWRVVFVCDQQNLVKQTVKRFEANGMRIGVVWAEARKHGLPVDPSAAVQVCSLQTLQAADRAAEKAGTVAAWRAWKGAAHTLWILDEAHDKTAWSKLGRELVDDPGESWFLLLTGSPYRLSAAEGMGDIADHLAAAPTYREMIEIGVPELVEAYQRHGHRIDRVGAILPVKYIVMEPKGRISTEGVDRGADGDLSVSQLAANAMHPDVMRAQLREWQRWNPTRTLAFCCTVEHAERAAEVWRDAGYACGVVTGTEAKTYVWIDGKKVIVDRDDGVCAMLARGELRIVFSVAAMIKGVDIPEIDCGLCLRPTESLAFVIQMVGRIRRPCARLGKLFALWLDATRNFCADGARLMLPEMIHEFRLEKGRGKGARRERPPPATKECPRCKAVVPKSTIECTGVLPDGDNCTYTWMTATQIEMPGLENVTLVGRELTIATQTAAETKLMEQFRKEQRDSYHGARFGQWRGGRHHPGKPAVQWHDKHGKWPPDAWYRGAVFGDRATDADRAMYEIFLRTVAIRRRPEKREREPDARFVERFMRLEFGKAEKDAEVAA